MKNIKIMILGLCVVMPMQASDRSNWALCLGAGCAAGTFAAYATTKLMHGQSLWPLRGIESVEAAGVAKRRAELEAAKVAKIQLLERKVENLEGFLQAHVEQSQTDREASFADKETKQAAILALQRQVLPQNSQRRFVVQAPRSPGVLSSAPGFDSASDEDESAGILPGTVAQAAAVWAVQAASLPQYSSLQRQRRGGVSAGVGPVGMPALSLSVGDRVNTIQ